MNSFCCAGDRIRERRMRPVASTKGAILLAAIFSLSGCFLDPSRIPRHKDSNKAPNDASNVNKNNESDPFKTKVDYTNLIGMQFMKIQPGSFMMGSPPSEYKLFHSDEPVHQVTINYSFYLGKYEVTQEQYEAIMQDNPGKSGQCLNLPCCDEPKCPVENLSWQDTQAFLRKLNSKDDQYKYRLPSEAEWEYACRAGTTTVFAFGDQLSSDMANFNGDVPYGRAPKERYLRKAVRVGSYSANACFMTCTATLKSGVRTFITKATTVRPQTERQT